jgi:hypothetical protein
MYIKRTVHIALIIVFFILFMGSMRLMRFYANSVKNYGNEKILDLRFGYSTIDVNKFIALLTDNGRHIYLNRFYVIDSIYPVIYSIFYILVLSFLIGLCFPKNYKILCLLLLPIIGAICDYIENYFIKSFLKDIIIANDINIKISNIFTMIKFISIYVTFILFLVVVLLIKIIRNNVEWQTCT